MKKHERKRSAYTRKKNTEVCLVKKKIKKKMAVFTAKFIVSISKALLPLDTEFTVFWPGNSYSVVVSHADARPKVILGPHRNEWISNVPQSFNYTIKPSGTFS